MMGSENYEPQQKPEEGPCESYITKPVHKRPENCGKPGVRRVDHGVDSGIHCDVCWERLVREARQRSW